MQTTHIPWPTTTHAVKQTGEQHRQQQKQYKQRDDRDKRDDDDDASHIDEYA